MWKAFWRDESGATAIEYVLIAMFVAAAIIAGVTAIGTSLKVPLQKVSDTLR